jgi:hypothetical protein
MMSDAIETAPAEEAAPDLKLSDLQHALQIIDVAATRGAFRGPELSGVGTVRDRLSAFVTHMTPPAEDAAAPEADVAAEPAPAPKKKTRKAKGE